MSNPILYRPPKGSRIRLKDGTRCQLRPIGSDDRELLRAGFAGLSPASRRMRFFSAKPSLTEADLDFLTSADGRDHLALGAVRLDAWGQEVELLGVARCIRLGADADASEFAITVADAAQGRGLGTLLLTQLVTAAREQGIRHFRCEVLAANTGMRALAAGLGSAVRWLDDGTLEYDYPLPAPDALDESARPSLSPLFDAAQRGAEAWSSGNDRVLAVSLELGQTWIEKALARWSAGWSVIANPRVLTQHGQKPLFLAIR